MRDLVKRPFYGVIKEYSHWVVLFREPQVTPGSLIIMDKTVRTKSLGDISADAWAEFGTVTKEVEAWLKQAFGAEKFNSLALMMKDPEVHFHLIPRYSQPVVVGDKKYLDPDWPLATTRKALDLTEDEQAAIKATLLEVVK